MSNRHPPVHVIELEERIVPDNSFDEAYAIYYRLSHEPPFHWQDAFEELMKLEVEPRIVSFVGPSLRVVIDRLADLESITRQIAHLTRKTNTRLELVD